MNPRPSHFVTQTYQESAVLSLTAEQVLVRLYDSCLRRLEQAEICQRQGNRSAMGLHITKALAIIDALQEALDRDMELDLIPRLDQLYQTVRAWLVEANLQQQSSPLQSSRRILGILKEGWDGAIAQTSA